jgi:pyruvate kinase
VTTDPSVALADHKTRIVATIGPASASRRVMEEMIAAGMDVARLNFSHGDRDSLARVIADLRAAAAAAGRIGAISPEPVELEPGGVFTLVVGDETGDASRASVPLAGLPAAVRPGTMLFLNDGLIQLEVEAVEREAIRCRVVVGGELRSRKGLNLPGIDLGIPAFTERDRDCLAFALEHGVDIVSQSFVGRAADVVAVREAAAASGHHPVVIAKIERASAIERIEEILDTADGIMVARGDLGVEVPIEGIAVLQKDLIRRANLRGRPVITATQMLESMVTRRRPTRAEATDVANAILDGTDAVMLSEESATGAFPVEAVGMLAGIAAAVEPHRKFGSVAGGIEGPGPTSHVDLVALAVMRTCERASPAAVFVPTVSGTTARSVARFRLPVWVVAVSPHESTCRALQLSWGVIAVHRPEEPADWNAFVRSWLRDHRLGGDIALLTEGPSERNPGANNRMEIIDVTPRGLERV